MNTSYNYADFIGLNLDSNTVHKNRRHDPQDKPADTPTFKKDSTPNRISTSDRHPR